MIWGVRSDVDRFVGEFSCAFLRALLCRAGNRRLRRCRRRGGAEAVAQSSGCRPRPPRGRSGRDVGRSAQGDDALRYRARRRSRVLLRCRGARSVLRHRRAAAARFQAGRPCRPSLRTVSEVPTPWVRLQDDLRRAGLDPTRLDRITDKTMEENEAALRAGTVDAIQVFQPYAERLIASVRAMSGTPPLRAAARPTRPGDTPRRVDERAGRAAQDDARLASHPGMVRRDTGPGHRGAAGEFLPRRPVRSLRRLHRTLSRGRLWAADPVIRREGYDRLHAAMRSGGALSKDIPFETCVDTKLAERASDKKRDSHTKTLILRRSRSDRLEG